MKKLILIAILIAMIASSAFAQLAMDGWTSPTSDATRTLYRSAADDFIRPDSYTSSGIEKWFAFTSFRSGNTVSLGYANKSEKLFLGIYYGGTFWADVTVPTSTETNNVTWNGVPNSKVKNYTLGAAADPLGANPNNRIGVLIGVADMGFRFSYYTTYETFSVSENSLINSTAYASYKTEQGIIDPQIAWSMAKNLTDNGLKPWVTIDLVFYRDYTEYETYIGANYDKSSIQIGRSQNYFSPQFRLGLGGITVTKKENFSGAIDLQYTLDIRNYDDNQYSYAGSDGRYKTSQFSGTYIGNNNSFTERAYVYNTITPSFTGTWSGEKLGLKFKLNLPLGFNNAALTQVYVDNTNNTGTLKKGTFVAGTGPANGYDRVTDTFTFQPVLQLAAKWQLHQRLTLNVGGLVTVGNINVETQTEDTYNNDNKVDNSGTTSVTTTFGATANTLSLGVTFTPTNYLTFEAASGVTNESSNAVNTFDTANTGLFYFYNLLVSLKF